MAGSQAFTADTSLDSTSDNAILSGSISVSGNAVTGFNTRFTDELKMSDSVSFTNDAGTTETKLVEVIINNNSLLFTATSGASTKTIATRRRAKLNDSNKNTSIFKLPYKTIKTLKTTANSGLTDTNFAVRRHFTVTYHQTVIFQLQAVQTKHLHLYLIEILLYQLWLHKFRRYRCSW